MRRTPLRLFVLAIVLCTGVLVFLSPSIYHFGTYWQDERIPTPLETGLPMQQTEPIKATLLVLTRNSDVKGIVKSMIQLEHSWNHKFNYPWTFFNDEPFTDEFKELTKQATNASIRYELIPKAHWEVPSWIDESRFKTSREKLKDAQVRYAELISYRQMCRWFSGFFFKEQALQEFEYYWRVEPDVEFPCSIDYDVFRHMKENSKTYGYTINIYDDERTIPNLWPAAIEYKSQHPEHISSNNAMGWLTNSERRHKYRAANGYSTCHFWSNFEIGDLKFFRSEKYNTFFNHLDKIGGFFYERWGDAPVHSIALGLLEDSSKIHWFQDIGYCHPPYCNCPASCKADCRVDFTEEPSLRRENCNEIWTKLVKEVSSINA